MLLSPLLLERFYFDKERLKCLKLLLFYEVDPLTCHKCSSKMMVISVIDDEDVIKKILKHLGLWDQKTRPPPKATGPPKIQEYQIDFSTSQLPVSDKWLYVDPEYPEVYPPLEGRLT